MKRIQTRHYELSDEDRQRVDDLIGMMDALRRDGPRYTMLRDRILGQINEIQNRQRNIDLAEFIEQKEARKQAKEEREERRRERREEKERKEAEPEVERFDERMSAENIIKLLRQQDQQDPKKGEGLKRRKVPCRKPYRLPKS
jgi:hypothetical protein